MNWAAIALAAIQFAIAVVAYLATRQKLSAAELRELADALSKQAEDLRKVADARADPDSVLPVDPFDDDAPRA